MKNLQWSSVQKHWLSFLNKQQCFRHHQSLGKLQKRAFGAVASFPKATVNWDEAKPDIPDGVHFKSHIIDDDTDLDFLACEKAFINLTDTEKFYCHFINQASWKGALINLFQTSPESSVLFVLILRIFREQSFEDVFKAAGEAGLTDLEQKRIQLYFSGFLANMGNYLSFGDSKFIPALPRERFELFLKNCSANVDDLWNEIGDRAYGLPVRQRQLGLGKEKGISTYYSANCEEEDAKFVQLFMDKIGLSPYNTRLFKNEDGTLVIKIASAEKLETQAHEVEGKTILVEYGDHQYPMSLIAKNLQASIEHVANEHEKNMMECYVDSFANGSIEAHKEGSKHWVKNKGPVVETYIGFIESYQDPFGVRGEWEGFAAVVDKETSATFQTMVDAAPEFLKQMPWSADYEKDRFLRPDFTSLEVVNFGSSSIPAGINIPNYDDIRQDVGFKNVSLGNVLRIRMQPKKKAAQYVTPEDQEIYKKWVGPSFDVQVACHELLGHGSGKLFRKENDGSFNFDKEAMKAKITEEFGAEFVNGTYWYEKGQTWDSVFLSMGSPMEECRAEAVGLYLSIVPEVLSLFGHEGQEAIDVYFANWLSMAVAGVKGLQLYSPKTNTFRQAHMHARHVLMRVMLEAGLIEISETTTEEGKPDIQVSLKREEILTTGKDCIGQFLKKLQMIKSTANIQAGMDLFTKYNSVDEYWMRLRQIVLDNKRPRGLWVQGNTSVTEEGVVFTAYDNSPQGCIQSMLDRFDENDCAAVMEQYGGEKDQVTDKN